MNRLLSPCPFCGSNATEFYPIHIINPDTEEEMICSKIRCLRCPASIEVCCKKTTDKLWDDVSKEAKKFWNFRQLPKCYDEPEGRG